MLAAKIEPESLLRNVVSAIASALRPGAMIGSPPWRAELLKAILRLPAALLLPAPLLLPSPCLLLRPLLRYAVLLGALRRLLLGALLLLLHLLPTLLGILLYALLLLLLFWLLLPLHPLRRLLWKPLLLLLLRLLSALWLLLRRLHPLGPLLLDLRLRLRPLGPLLLDLRLRLYPLRPLLLNLRLRPLLLLLLHTLLLGWGLLRTFRLLWPFGTLLLRRLLLLLSRPAPLLPFLFVFLMLPVHWYHRSHTQEEGGCTCYSSESHDHHSYSTFALARQRPSAAARRGPREDGRCRAHRQQHVAAPLAPRDTVHLPL